MRMKARLSLSALICLAFPCTVAHAIGFGEIVSQSPIGEPFRAQVRLHGVKAGEGGECLRLAPGPGFNGIPELVGAQIGLRQVNGQWIAMITRATPVFDPVIRMTLEETCSARLKRSYTLLLPLPAELVAPTASAPPAPAPAPSARARSAASERPTAFGSDALGGTYTLTEPSSINALARALYPRSRRDRQAFVAATRRANAVERSIRSARQRLATGTTLVIPSREEIEASREQIDRERRTSASAHPAAAKSAAKPTPRESRSPARQTPVEPTPTDNASPGSGQTTARGDRLMIMGDSPDTSGFKFSMQLGDPGIVERTTESEREQLRREQQMVMALDSQIIAQLELRDRIARLQALQEALRAELESQQSDTPDSSATQAPAAAASAYPDEVPTSAASTQAPVIDAAQPAAPAMSDDTAGEPAAEASSLLDILIQWWRPLALGALALLLGVLWWRRRQPPLTGEDELEALAALPNRTDDADAPEQAVEASASTRAGDADSFDFSTTEWDGAPPAELDHSIAPIAIDEDELAEEHASAVELADIMMSFGRVHGAAETLSDFIRGNPTQAVQPWIKLLEVYRAADMKAEFDGLAHQLNKTFNVKVIAWDDFESAVKALGSIEEMPHIVRTLQSIWGTTDCQAYIHSLLRDTRGGTREGFPLVVIDELLLLLAILEDQLGPYRVSNDTSTRDTAAAVSAAGAAAAQDDSGFVPPAPEPTDSAPESPTADPDKVGTESYLPDLDFNVESQREPFTSTADDTDALPADAGVTGLDFHLDSDPGTSSLSSKIDPNDKTDTSPPETRSTGLDFDLDAQATSTDADFPAPGASEEEENSMSRTFVQTNVDYRVAEDDAPDEDENEDQPDAARVRSGERKR